MILFDMNNRTIYTVITGNYDTIKQPQVITSGADYYLFTNNHALTDAGVWRVMYLDEDELTAERPGLEIKNNSIAYDNDHNNNVLLSRKVKMLAHRYLPSVYEWSIYLDADMLIRGDLNGLFNLLSGDLLMAAFRHSYHDSVKDEIDDLVSREVVKPAVVEHQWKRYHEWSFKDDLGITENGILIRRHNNPKVVELMELWWREYLHGSLRDQVSLMPCIYKCGFMPHLKFIEGDVRHNEWVEVMRHQGK